MSLIPLNSRLKIYYMVNLYAETNRGADIYAERADILY